jgi:hypothetical protein
MAVSHSAMWLVLLETNPLTGASRMYRRNLITHAPAPRYFLLMQDTITIGRNQHIRAFINGKKATPIVMRWKNFDRMCEFFRRTMSTIELVEDSVPLTRSPDLKRLLNRKLAEMSDER